MRPTLTTSPDGVSFRDLNGNGTLDPYEDPRLPTAVRVEDLLSRLSIEEKAGLMFHTVIEAGEDGSLLEGPGRISKSGTKQVVIGKCLNHFNVHDLNDGRLAARWYNRLQRLAELTPHGIPVTISTDPRHGFVQNVGASFAAGIFSQWPEPIGLAAIGEADTVTEFADMARQEYLAVGIRFALHPVADLATEPRWGRQSGTFGQSPDLASTLTRAYLQGFQTKSLGPTSVACTTKHFPGGGSQKDGEDAHFPYGREQIYPAGRFADHLAPFRVAIAEGTAAMMPYYGMPIGLVLGGEPVEEVGFGYNARIINGLLREELGYDGVVLSDWELINDNHVGDQVLPARAWGVEHLDATDRLATVIDAGVDQLGGEECTDLLLQLVAEGQVLESRIDESARRLLRVKFDLGLFDDPFVNETEAVTILNDPMHREAGHRAQARSVTVVRNEALPSGAPALPLSTHSGLRLYVEGVSPDEAGRLGTVVDRPEQADFALVRLATPFEPRSDLFLEKYFHQGSLEFPPGLVSRLVAMARLVPILLDVHADRPPILTPILELSVAVTLTYGTSDAAWIDALTKVIPPVGRLPFDLPRSMESIRDHGLTDRPGSTDDPLFRCGHGLSI